METLFENDITGTIGRQKYLCQISWRNGTITMDEPVSSGGEDLGPDPHSVLLASLAGCTLATLRMYIDRKGWDIPEIYVSLNLAQEKEREFTTFIKREVRFSNAIAEEQKERLLSIADKCPISKLLTQKVIINTQLLQ